MKRFLIFIFIFILALPLTALPVSAQTTNRKNRKSKHLIAVFKEQPTAKNLLRVTSKKSKSKLKYGLSGTKAMVFEATTEDVEGALSELAADPDLQTVYEDRELDLLYIPNDLTFTNPPAPGKPHLQWNMFNAKFAGTGRSAWDVNKGSAGTVVAVIDSGVDSSHEDLSGKMSSLVDCTATCQVVPSMSVNPQNLNQSHGTHVAGIVAAATDNKKGVAGSGFNTNMMIIKIMDSQGAILTSYFSNAIKYAADRGVKVINLSLGSLEGNLDAPTIAAINSAVAYAWGKGAVIVAAAGNCGKPVSSHQAGGDACDIYDSRGNYLRHAANEKYYPAASPNVISVAALDINNQLAPYSEYNEPAKTGNWITVAAPGGNFSTNSDKEFGIGSTWPGNQYFYDLGTSMAAPHVSGLAALIFAAKPSLSNAQVKSIIESSSIESVVAGKTNWGSIDALAALEAVSGVTPSLTPTSPTFTPTPTDSIKTPTPSRTRTPTPSSSFKKGDANGDGRVDGQDYTIWRLHYNQTISGSRNGDFDGNGKVDGADYAVWHANYNK